MTRLPWRNTHELMLMASRATRGSSRVSRFPVPVLRSPLMFAPVRRLAPLFSAVALGLGMLVARLPAEAQDGDLRVSRNEPKYTAIVMDARTGEVLYDKRADSPRYPASITKIMTMYMAFEQMASGKLKPTDMI